MNTPDDMITPDDVRLWRRVCPAAQADRLDCPTELDLSAWLSDRADQAEAAQIERHLANCPRCERAVIELRELLAGGPVLAPPAVLARARSLVGRPTGWLHGFAWRSVAAAAVLLVSYLGFQAGSATYKPQAGAASPPTGQFAGREVGQSTVAEATGGLIDSDQQPLLDGDDLLVAMGDQP